MSLATVYDTLSSLVFYSLATVFDICQRTFTSVRRGIKHREPQLGVNQAPISLVSPHMTRIVLVTQACSRVATYFSVYDMSDGAQHCEYFLHERRFFPSPNTQGHISRIEMALDLRRKALLHALRFYQDVLCHAATAVHIYTDLADYHFSPEINAILEQVRESHGQRDGGMEQVKHASPNRLLHRITTETQHPTADYVQMTRIQSAAVQLQKNKVSAFKRIIGLEKTFALVGA